MKVAIVLIAIAVIVELGGTFWADLILGFMRYGATPPGILLTAGMPA